MCLKTTTGVLQREVSDDGGEDEREDEDAPAVAHSGQNKHGENRTFSGPACSDEFENIVPPTPRHLDLQPHTGLVQN